MQRRAETPHRQGCLPPHHLLLRRRCSDVVFQDAQVFLYKLPNNNLIDRGNRVREYTDWSISQGAYPGAEKTERYRLVLDVELQTPDGSPWAEFGSDDCEGEGTPVVRCHVSKTFKVT